MIATCAVMSTRSVRSGLGTSNSALKNTALLIFSGDGCTARSVP
ncbi:Uncharacterised protein [Mycobacterium tuberculosis]|nr:Uncharacterised protein [Mycobacterium tuberculosis]